MQWQVTWKYGVSLMNRLLFYYYLSLFPGFWLMLMGRSGRASVRDGSVETKDNEQKRRKKES